MNEFVVFLHAQIRKCQTTSEIKLSIWVGKQFDTRFD